MNLLQELQTRTLSASKSTDEEVQSIYDVICKICLQQADLGNDHTHIHETDVCDIAECRVSAFDDAFARAMSRVADSGVAVRSNRHEEHLFMLEWAV